MRSLTYSGNKLSGPPVAATGPPDGLTLLCEGLTNKEIAREVNRSVGTVKNHVRSILSELDLPQRGAVHAYLHQPAAARR
jgi:Bacterial regulatory proteins, luxR family